VVSAAALGFQRLPTPGGMITVSELGALQRFDHPRQLTAYLGLVPSESTRTAYQSWCWQQLRTAAMRFQSFDCPLSAIEYPLPAKFQLNFGFIKNHVDTCDRPDELRSYAYG
jgi:hypothetical protein